MSPDWITGIASQFGPFVALLTYCIWRDKVREDRLGKRIDILQDRYSETMDSVVKENTAALVSNTKILDRLGRALEHHMALGDENHGNR